MIRFVANQENCSEAQVETAWELIKEFAVEVLSELPAKRIRPAGGAQKWKMTLTYLKSKLIFLFNILSKLLSFQEEALKLLRRRRF